ncbi:MAG: FecR domain-containing protein [Pseudomonadota bacterium]
MAGDGRDVADKQDRALTDEAVGLFLRLRDTPGDAAARGARDAFVSRGAAERRAWERVVRVWGAQSAMRRQRTTLLPMLVLAAVGVAALLFAGDVRLMMVADAVSGRDDTRVVLASGDIAHLDAGSAIGDATAEGRRDVDLIAGAAFFDVDASPERPFSVAAGPLTATAIGTAFEVAHLDDGVSVAVAKGVVQVAVDGESARLGPGDVLAWNAGETTLVRSGGRAIAAWRRDRLILENMRLEAAVDIVARRLIGPVMVLGVGQRDLALSGTFTLDRPLSALRSMAAAHGGRVYAAGPLGTIVVMP